MTGKRIVFTGGTGKAGRHAVPHLVAHGYDVLNVDLKPLDFAGVPTVIADLTDSGQAFNALTIHRGFEGFEIGRPAGPPDAVVHFAAVPRVLIEPDNVMFTKNVISTYNVIEAAMKLGVRKVIIASSETTYGVCFAEGDQVFHACRWRRITRRSARFLWALESCNEATAHAFAMRNGADIYAIRIGNVIEPHEYEHFPGFFEDPAGRKRCAWSYIDARDLGQLVPCASRRTGLASRCSTRPTTPSP